MSLAPTWSAPWAPGAGQAQKLVLWWDGALVPEGWDRARRAQVKQVWTQDASTALEAEFLGRRLVATGLASRVVRLARVDGRLVEVP